MDCTTPDGSPVDLYRLLPALGEPEQVHDAIAPGAEVLELGCGVGRITHPLVALGHRVVAVDESKEMLANVHGAETVCARIEELDLGRRFPVVLLMSNLVNAPPEQRESFLETCRRHVSDEGVVLIERLDPNWDPDVGEDRELGPVRTRVRGMRRDGRRVSGVVEYRAEGRTWRHEFESELMDDDELAGSLDKAGLVLHRVLDDQRRWVEARPSLFDLVTQAPRLAES